MKIEETVFTKKDTSERALDLSGKIKNLQVSISIFRKEQADLEFKVSHTDIEEEPELVSKWETRIETLKANIEKKETELLPLKDERTANKNFALEEKAKAKLESETAAKE